MATPGKRPFWLHQAAEYLIGAVFVAQGLQSPTPVVPAVLGGLVMLNAACAKGPLSAFRLAGRRTHRFLDAIVIGLIFFATVQPWISIESSTRLIMGLLGFVLAFIWWNSDFVEAPARPRSASTGGAEGATAAAAPTSEPDGTLPDTIGRTAGRLAGKGVNAYRTRRDQLKR